jgi:uncharacterized protein (DUF1810 family)
MFACRFPGKDCKNAVEAVRKRFPQVNSANSSPSVQRYLYKTLFENGAFIWLIFSGPKKLSVHQMTCMASKLTVWMRIRG